MDLPQALRGKVNAPWVLRDDIQILKSPQPKEPGASIFSHSTLKSQSLKSTKISGNYEAHNTFRPEQKRGLRSAVSHRARRFTMVNVTMQTVFLGLNVHLASSLANTSK